jgi:endoglucanase
MSSNHESSRVSRWFKPAAAAAALSCALLAANETVFDNDTDTSHTTAVSALPEVNGINPLKGTGLYDDPDANADKQARAWRTAFPDKAAWMSKLAEQPTAKWLTSDDSINEELTKHLKASKVSGGIAALVVYNIPHRDCNQFSRGGSADLESYQRFIDRLATTIGGSKTALIIEPDALASIDSRNYEGQICLADEHEGGRYQALNYAVSKLGKLGASSVYIDAGNSGWVRDPGVMAARLQAAGIAGADGFSLNTANFQTTADSIAFGRNISRLVGGKHFIIDTSRNGVGPFHNPELPGFDWCNPPDRALGHYPTTDTREPLVDAYMYIKVPGESDGQDPDWRKCHGGPRAGDWWPDYALGLVQRWPVELQPPEYR